MSATDSPIENGEKPLVSVIMNCYNGAEYLRDAVDSVLSQSYKNFELIFWDNQSSDDSADIFNNYADERLRYYYAPDHTLLYEARNYAIEKADGEFITFLDVDDKWFSNKLEKQMLHFIDPEVGIVCGNYWIESERKKKQWLALNNKVPTGRVLDDLLKSYFVGLLTLIIRKEAFDALSYPCDARYHIIGDFDLVIRLSVDWKLEYVPEPIAIYRLHENNESNKHVERHIDELECWLKDMTSNESIRLCKNFHVVKYNCIYLKAINESLQGRKKEVYALFQKLPWGLQKFRLLMAIILPTILIKKLKN